jgi:L-ascorbate metabolism protein UlaG (beta-lactamase superfamily)
MDCTMTVTHGDLTIDWYGYATVRLGTPEQTIYLDPGRYGVLTGEWDADSETAADHHPAAVDRRPEDADAVFLSHVHHYDPDGIDRVSGPETTVVAADGINARNSSRDLPRLSELPQSVRRVEQEAEGVVADVPFWTVPAYNEPDGPHSRIDGTPFHPEGRGVGFLLSVAGYRVFWPGDSDALEGHEELAVDVFLPPIGGSFTMDRREAALLAANMNPDLVVPIHYNTFDALETDSTAFATDVSERSIPVALDE